MWPGSPLSSSIYDNTRQICLRAPLRLIRQRKTFKKVVYDVLIRTGEVNQSTPELRIVRKSLWGAYGRTSTNPWCLTWWNRRGLRQLVIVPTNDTGRHPPDGHKLRLTMRRTGLYSTQNYRMCGGTAHLDLNTGKTGDDTSYGTQAHTTWLDDIPAFQYWPPQTQAALLCIISHLVYYRLQSRRRLSLREFMDFMRRARWKAHSQSCKRPNTGRYLDLLWRPRLVVGIEERQPESRDHPECVPWLPRLPRAWCHSQNRPSISHFFVLTMYTGYCQPCTMTNG